MFDYPPDQSEPQVDGPWTAGEIRLVDALRANAAAELQLLINRVEILRDQLATLESEFIRARDAWAMFSKLPPRGDY